MIRAASIVAAGSCAAVVAAAGPAVAPAWAAPKAMECTAPHEVLRLGAKLSNTARAIRRDEQLIIVAIGSSSTEGVGATSRANSYPARFARELSQRWPKLRLKVINEGVGGETAGEMLARFETDVMAHDPHLVIWQAGSNALLLEQGLDEYLEVLREGLMRLKTARTDVIVMDPQFAPMVIAQPLHRRLIDATADLANDLRVGLFQRFEVMRHWISSGKTRIEDVISRDRLHMNDASYRCIARLLADSVSTAVREGASLTPADARRPPQIPGAP